MATNYNTGRTGWNRRGPSDKDMLAIQRKMIIEDNSKKWEELALGAASDLLDLVGREVFDAWVDANIPDNGLTWREIYRLTEARINQAIIEFERTHRLFRAAVEIDIAVGVR